MTDLVKIATDLIMDLQKKSVENGQSPFQVIPLWEKYYKKEPSMKEVQKHYYELMTIKYDRVYKNCLKEMKKQWQT